MSQGLVRGLTFPPGTGGGGGGSVTSTELSAVSATAAAGINAVSNNLSVLCAAVSAVSARSVGDVSTHGLQSVVDALSNRISAIPPGGGSVTSAEVQAVSTQAASALSQALSALSVTDAGLSVRIDTQSQSISALSNANSAGHASLAQAISVISQQVSLISVNVVSLQSTVSHLASAVSLVSTVSGAGTAVGLQSVVNALSNRLSALSASDTSINDRISGISTNLTSVQSTVSDLRSAVSNVSATSAGGGSATGLQAVVDALSNKISTVVGGSQSVTSAEYVSTLSDVSHLRSIVSLVSTVSGAGTAVGLQSVINALSNRISAAGGGGGSTNVAGFVSVSNVLSGTTIVPISGLSVSVSAGGHYKLECWVGYVRADTSTPVRFGFSLPPMKKTVMRVWHIVSSPAGQVSVPPAAGGQPAENVFRGVDSLNGSMLVSQAASSITRLSTIVVMDGVLNVSTTGVVQALWGGAVGKNVTIEGDRMSFIRVYKI